MSGVRAEREDRTGCTDRVLGREGTSAASRKAACPGDRMGEGGWGEEEGACVKGRNCGGPASGNGRGQGRLAGGGARLDLTMKALGVWRFSTLPCMYTQRWGFGLMNTN